MRPEGVGSGCAPGSSRKAAQITARWCGLGQHHDAGRPEIVEVRQVDAGAGRFRALRRRDAQPRPRVAAFGEGLARRPGARPARRRSRSRCAPRRAAARLAASATCGVARCAWRCRCAPARWWRAARCRRCARAFHHGSCTIDGLGPRQARRRRLRSWWWWKGCRRPNRPAGCRDRCARRRCSRRRRRAEQHVGDAGDRDEVRHRVCPAAGSGRRTRMRGCP